MRCPPLPSSATGRQADTAASYLTAPGRSGNSTVTGDAGGVGELGPF
ncbi:hypothetical protein [Streptomyces viridochromogenes]|uniref:Uncharacterized protein n=1 Tax=Streptomyces viridochromogenes Tue57 TaxID=1160705 RepID=L8P7U3_STRVR|nr:hypothetical protein [Streptomyces viridochromogenes]ELS52239.1 hypothetical protein STVIR_6804 [Streptomyces viridochromogenes Tue57]